MQPSARSAGYVVQLISQRNVIAPSFATMKAITNKLAETFSNSFTTATELSVLPVVKNSARATVLHEQKKSWMEIMV